MVMVVCGDGGCLVMTVVFCVLGVVVWWSCNGGCVVWWWGWRGRVRIGVC